QPAWQGCSPSNTERGREREGGPLPAGHSAHGRALVGGVSLALASWGSPEGSAWRDGHPHARPTHAQSSLHTYTASMLSFWAEDRYRRSGKDSCYSHSSFI